MEASKYQRDAKRVQQALRRVKDSLKVVSPLAVHIPKRYAVKELANVGSTVSIVGIFGIVVDDRYYGVSLVNAMMVLTPSNINTIIVDDVEYYSLEFQPGDTFMPNVNLVKEGTLVYQIFDEIVAKGNTPWYLGYRDLGQLFDTALHHGGANLNTNHAILEMITAARARSPRDRTVFYRHQFKDTKQLEDKPPEIIALRSVQDGASNTTAKLMGAYLDEGINSALVDPAERLERVEDLLRR